MFERQLLYVGRSAHTHIVQLKLTDNPHLGGMISLQSGLTIDIGLICIIGAKFRTLVTAHPVCPSELRYDYGLFTAFRNSLLSTAGVA